MKDEDKAAYAATETGPEDFQKHNLRWDLLSSILDGNTKAKDHCTLVLAQIAVIDAGEAINEHIHVHKLDFTEGFKMSITGMEALFLFAGLALLMQTRNDFARSLNADPYADLEPIVDRVWDRFAADVALPPVDGKDH